MACAYREHITVICDAHTANNIGRYRRLPPHTTKRLRRVARSSLQSARYAASRQRARGWSFTLQRASNNKQKAEAGA